MVEATVNVNGIVTPGDQAVISVFDHGFLYGDGVYETLRTYNRQPFLLERHLARLRASAARLSLHVPPSNQALEARMRDTMARVHPNGEVTIRMLVTRGIGELSYDPAACPVPTIVIIARAHHDTPDAVLRDGARVVVANVLRNHPRSVDPSIKSNNLLNNVLAMQEAVRLGADEAILLNHRGELAECSQSNLFAVRHGVVLTPALDAGCSRELPGICCSRSVSTSVSRFARRCCTRQTWVRSMSCSSRARRARCYRSCVSTSRRSDPANRDRSPNGC